MGGNSDTKCFRHRNGVPTRADGHRIHLSQDGSLVISNIQEADEGSYTCSAYSSSNSVSASTEVKVLRSRPSSEYSPSSPLLPAQRQACGHRQKSVPVHCRPPALGRAVGAPGLCHPRSPAFPGQQSRMAEVPAPPGCWEPNSLPEAEML